MDNFTDHGVAGHIRASFGGEWAGDEKLAMTRQPLISAGLAAPMHLTKDAALSVRCTVGMRAATLAICLGDFMKSGFWGL